MYQTPGQNEREVFDDARCFFYKRSQNALLTGKKMQVTTVKFLRNVNVI